MLDEDLLTGITCSDDMGYEVNYSAADAFTVADLDASVTGCVCERRERRSIIEMDHGEVIMFGEGNKSPRKRALRLSDELTERAISIGMGILEKSKSAEEALVGRDDSVRYVGDKVVSVVMYQDGRLYGVIVKR